MAHPHPDFSGLWRLDADASRFHGPAPAALLMMIDHHEPMVTQHIIATDSAGKEQRRVFACRTGEETISAIGETSLRCCAYWEADGSELVIQSTMTRQDRDLVFTDRWSLSADGDRLTMEHRDGALAGQCVILTRDDSAAGAFEPPSTPA